MGPRAVALARVEYPTDPIGGLAAAQATAEARLLQGIVVSQRRAERILIIEDSPTVLLQMRVALEQAGFTVDTASDGASGIDKARTFAPHCILLDYHLPDMTGAQVVASVRELDRCVQIVLVTGRSDVAPALDMMQRLDIQGFHDKADGMARLMVWVEAALKAHARHTLIVRQAHGLQQVLAATGAIHRMQPVDELYHAALEQVLHMVRLQRGLPAAMPVHGLAVRFDAGACGTRAMLVAASGRYRECDGLDSLDVATRRLLTQLATENGTAPRELGTLFALPIRLDDDVVGAFVVDLERAGERTHVADFLALLASQIALSLRNIRLYEMATVDTVTGLMSRAYIHQRLVEWLKVVIRAGQPLSLVYLDMDRLKPINDTHGHVVGDEVLAELGQRLRATVRDIDSAGRLGGDEFLVTLPSASPVVARRIAERIRAAICDTPARVRGLELELRASIGVGGFDLLPLASWMRASRPESAWHRLATHFIELVDAACYAAKGRGGGQVVAVDDDGLSLTEALVRCASELG